MTATITNSSTCGTCIAVTGRCVGCQQWFCSHLLKRWAGQPHCAECFPEAAS